MKFTLTILFIWLGIIAITYGCFRLSETLGWIVLGFWCFAAAVGTSFSRYVEEEKKKKARIHESNQ